MAGRENRFRHLLEEVRASTPRNCNSTFEPQLIKKRETIQAENVADRITGLYTLGSKKSRILCTFV